MRAGPRKRIFAPPYSPMSHYWTDELTLSGGLHAAHLLSPMQPGSDSVARGAIIENDAEKGVPNELDSPQGATGAGRQCPVVPVTVAPTIRLVAGDGGLL